MNTNVSTEISLRWGFCHGGVVRSFMACRPHQPSVHSWPAPRRHFLSSVGAILCTAAAAIAQSLSFTASPNPGASPLTTTITWTTTNIPGSLPHYVRITGQGFDPNEDLPTSGSRVMSFYNGTASATQSASTAALWRFDHSPTFQGERITSNGMQFVEGSTTEVNAGLNPTFQVGGVSDTTIEWSINVPGHYINGGGSQSIQCSIVIPASCPTGDYDIIVAGGYNGEASASLKLRVNGVPTVRTNTGISANLTVTTNPDNTSAISANPTSGEAPAPTTITWAAADYGSAYSYHVSGPGFVGIEEVTRTGSRAVVAFGQPGQSKTSTFTLYVIPKYTSPYSIEAWGSGQTATYRVTGSMNGGVYGTDYYSIGCSLATVAVHAGLVADGQPRNITVTAQPLLNVVSPGTTRNGVTSTSFSRVNTYSFTLVGAPAGTPLLTRTVDVTALDRPTAPTALNYAEMSATSVTLVWRASRDQVGVVGYNFYRGGTLFGSTADLVFDDTGLSANTMYAYTVIAVALGGNLSLASNTLNVTTPDFSSDSDHDGIPDATETALGTAVNTAAGPETINLKTEQNIHRPNL